jgi:hypothetical protein
MPKNKSNEGWMNPQHRNPQNLKKTKVSECPHWQMEVYNGNKPVFLRLLHRLDAIPARSQPVSPGQSWPCTEHRTLRAACCTSRVPLASSNKIWLCLWNTHVPSQSKLTSTQGLLPGLSGFWHGPRQCRVHIPVSFLHPHLPCHALRTLPADTCPSFPGTAV